MNLNETLPKYELSNPLQTEFISNKDGCGDHIFTQVKRSGPICLYKRTSLRDGRLRGYELFKVKLIKAGSPLPNGGTVEKDYEQYPSSNQFGKTAIAICGEKAEERAEYLFNQWVANPESNKISADIMVEKKNAEPKMKPEKKVVKVIVKTKPTTKRVRSSAEPVNFNFPVGEFTQKDFALANNMPPRGRVYGVMQKLVGEGLLKPIGFRKAGSRGRSTAYFSKP